MPACWFIPVVVLLPAKRNMEAAGGADRQRARARRNPPEADPTEVLICFPVSGIYTQVVQEAKRMYICVIEG